MAWTVNSQLCAASPPNPFTPQVISVSNEQLNADTVTAAIEAEGNEGAAYCADVRQASAVADLYKFALEKYGRIDGVINSGVHNAANNGGCAVPQQNRFFLGSLLACCVCRLVCSMMMLCGHALNGRVCQNHRRELEGRN